MTKTPDEIKKGLECCIDGNIVCAGNCVFDDDVKLGYPDCVKLLMTNAIVFIQQLEAERDAAVGELVGTCQVCRWEETEKCASCHFCEDAWNVHESNWEWRGVKKEENDNGKE